MGYRNYSTAVSHIVDATGQGDFTTISAAIAAASSGQDIFIRPGTYTENPTLKAGVNLTAFGSDQTDGTVTILGKTSVTFNGSVVCSGINFQTNGDYSFAITGSNAPSVFLNNCRLTASNNTSLNFASSSGSAFLELRSCVGDITATGNAIFTQSCPGGSSFIYCHFDNSSGSTTSNTITAGLCSPVWSSFTNPTSTAAGNIEAEYCVFETSALNATAMISDGTLDKFEFCKFAGGSAAALTVNGSAQVSQSLVSSNTTNVITGGGTLNAGIITFLGTGTSITTSTVNKLTTYGGTIV